MSKRRRVSVTVLSAFALTMICLLSAVTTAQKELQGTASSVKPVKGIDVVVMKDPGNSAARTGTTDEKGEVKFAGLEPGTYSLAIVDNSRAERTGIANRGGITSPAVASQTGDRYEIEINGAVGGSITREWNI